MHCGCSTTELYWLLRIAGGGLGFILAFIYVHIAWFRRGSGKFRTSSKIGGLALFSLTNGVALSIGFAKKSLFPAALYTTTVGFLSVLLLLLVLVSTAYFAGYNSSIDPTERKRLALRCLNQAFFLGWPFAHRIINLHSREIHKLSKNNLARFVNSSFRLVASPDPIEFRHAFKSVIGAALCLFFQHTDKNEHPDFCASYYRYNPKTSKLDFVVRILGDSAFHAEGQSVLGSDSFAMKALRRGTMCLYPQDMRTLGIKKLTPPLRKTGSRHHRLRNFLVIPVPCDETLPLGQRYGVISIDSMRNNCWQLADKFHRDVLIFGAYVTAELHKLYLDKENG